MNRVAAFDGAPEELDITLFETVGSDFVSIERAASTLVAKVRPVSHHFLQDHSCWCLCLACH